MLNIVMRTRGMDLGARRRYTGRKSRMKTDGLGLARVVLGTKGRMRSFFEACTEDDGSSKNYFYYAGKDRINVPRKWTGEYKRVMFEGIELNALKNIEKLTEKICGDNIRKYLKSGGWPAGEWGVYYDTEHPYAEVMKDAESAGTDFERLARERADYDEFSAKVYRKKLSKADKEYYYVWRTINRFMLLEELGPKTEEICRKYQDGLIDEVREELRDYTEQIENYTAKGMGFSFDTALFDIACSIMEQDGKGDIAAKARKLLPDEFREPLADYLHRERSV